jgi:hypothetical protein
VLKKRKNESVNDTDHAHEQNMVVVREYLAIKKKFAGVDPSKVLTELKQLQYKLVNSVPTELFEAARVCSLNSVFKNFKDEGEKAKRDFKELVAKRGGGG